MVIGALIGASAGTAGVSTPLLHDIAELTVTVNDGRMQEAFVCQRELAHFPAALSIRNVNSTKISSTDGSASASSTVIKDRPAGLLMTSSQIDRAKQRIKSKREPFVSSCTALISRAAAPIRPFRMHDPITDMKYGWCPTSPGRVDEIDNTLREFVNAVLNDMTAASAAAHKWLLTGDLAAATRALYILERWNTEATIVNMYDFGVDFTNSTFIGMTADGFCGVRPWNFALDMGWVAYGLRAASSAYLILRTNGYPLTEANHNNIKALIRRLAATTDSSLDAWTESARVRSPQWKWFTRYVSDNHIAEFLSGLAAAAAALGDDEGNRLIDYVVNGGSFDFGNGNSNSSFVSLKQYLGNALLYEPNTSFVVYHDYFWKENYRAYHAAVQTALGTLFRTLDLHFPREAGLYAKFRTPKGFTAMQAAETLANYLNGDVTGGAADSVTRHYDSQLAMELAYSASETSSSKHLLEKALYRPLSPGKRPRGQFLKEYDLSTCIIGEDIRE